MELDDGRYLDQSPGGPFLLALETEGALPPARRKRRRPRRTESPRDPVTVPLTVATVVFAGSPLEVTAAPDWLRESSSDPRLGELIETALTVLERGLAAACSTTGRAIGEPPGPSRIAAARIGYGEGERVYEGRYREALEVDAAGGEPGGRRGRVERIVPLPAIVAILAGREPLNACEVLIPRVRVDLDAGRTLPAALTIGEAVRATLAELESTLDDPDHEADLDRLEQLLPDLLRLPARLLGEGAPAAETADRPEIRDRVKVALEIAERVIRRCRVSSR